MRNIFKISLVVVAMVALSTGSAWAFHDAGVAYCAGCHTMHNSQNGALVDAAHPAGNAYLLNNGNASDTCLRCHADYGQFAGGFGWGAGGDFYWITKTWSWTAHGHAYSSAGDSHGHNVISPAFGISEDATLQSAPGGDFDAQYLTCTSCHDPHGNTNFRMLYGNTGDGPIYGGVRYDFTNPAPEAVGNSRVTNINNNGTAPETDLSHTVYKSGMSLWCSNCHGAMYYVGNTNHVHPNGIAMGSTTAAVYNAYVSTDNQTGGSQATAYTSLVPFEDVSADLATVDTNNYTTGPDAQDQVMCLTCHRAHASPFSDAGRWDFTATLMDEARPQTTADGASDDDLANMWYGHTFSVYQRSLCNKCHVKDFGDEGAG